MAVTARSHGTAYGHRTLTEWERAMTTLTTNNNNNRELTEALTEVELEYVVGGFGVHGGHSFGGHTFGNGGSGTTSTTTGGLGSVSASISGGTSV
jgi:hypothetical protein